MLLVRISIKFHLIWTMDRCIHTVHVGANNLCYEAVSHGLNHEHILLLHIWSAICKVLVYVSCFFIFMVPVFMFSIWIFIFMVSFFICMVSTFVFNISALICSNPISMFSMSGIVFTWLLIIFIMGLPAHDMVFILFTFLRGLFKSSVFNSFKNAIFIFNKCGNW